jgi:hypothetical protein
MRILLRLTDVMLNGDITQSGKPNKIIRLHFDNALIHKTHNANTLF